MSVTRAEFDAALQSIGADDQAVDQALDSVITKVEKLNSTVPADSQEDFASEFEILKTHKKAASDLLDKVDKAAASIGTADAGTVGSAPAAAVEVAPDANVAAGVDAAQTHASADPAAGSNLADGITGGQQAA